MRIPWEKAFRLSPDDMTAGYLLLHLPRRSEDTIAAINTKRKGRSDKTHTPFIHVTNLGCRAGKRRRGMIHGT